MIAFTGLSKQVQKAGGRTVPHLQKWKVDTGVRENQSQEFLSASHNGCKSPETSQHPGEWRMAEKYTETDLPVSSLRKSPSPKFIYKVKPSSQIQGAQLDKALRGEGAEFVVHSDSHAI